MAIWDTFLFRDELDLLEMRLEQLGGVVDVFVICEAGLTHGRCEPKPYHFAENVARYEKWAHKIVYLRMPDELVPRGVNPWPRELFQRNYIAHGLAGARPDDLILHGDVDEIPDPGKLALAAGRTERMAVFEQSMTHFAVDWLDPELWRGTVAARARTVNHVARLWELRSTLPRIHEGGWHFSKLGGVQAQMNHVIWGCHEADAVKEGAWEHIVTGKAYAEGWHQGQRKLIPVDVDDTWPAYITERRCPPEWFRPR